MEKYLKHYGVLGMKWGVRRYQPYPKGQASKGKFVGSTEKSKIKPTEDQMKEAIKKHNIKKQYEKTLPPSKIESTKKKLDYTSDIVRDTRNISQSISDMRSTRRHKIDLSSMSDQELRERVNRLNMERQYASLSSNEVSKGESHVSNTLNIAGNLLGIASTSLAIALSIQKLKD